MEIKTGQELYLKNVLSHRKKMTQAEIPMELQKIKSFLEKNDLMAHDIVSVTFSAVHGEDGVVLMDTEFLVSLEKEIKDVSPYSIKAEIRIVNALCVDYEGSSTEIPGLYNEINTYLLKNSLQAITAAYTVSVDAFRSTPEKMKVRIYVGINPNTL